MLSFFMLFGLITLVFFILSGITFFGDDAARWLDSWETNRKIEQEKREKRANELAQMKEQGVDILAEHHASLRAKMQAQRYKLANDWEQAFAAETGERPRLLAPDIPVLSSGRNDIETITGQYDGVLEGKKSMERLFVSKQDYEKEQAQQRFYVDPYERDRHEKSRLRADPERYVSSDTRERLRDMIERGELTVDMFETITGEHVTRYTQRR